MALRLGALGLLIYVAVTLIQPFIAVAIWSIVIAVALAYERLADWLGGRRRLAAALITIAKRRARRNDLNRRAGQTVTQLQ